MANKHCINNIYKQYSFDAIEAAKKACLALGDDCTGVYDQFCNGKPYKLCKPGVFQSSSYRSCVYTPPGRYAFMYACKLPTMPLLCV